MSERPKRSEVIDQIVALVEMELLGLELNAIWQLSIWCEREVFGPLPFEGKK